VKKGKRYMGSEAWRNNYTFVTIAVPMKGQDFLTRFNRKLTTEGFKSKSELFRLLLKNWLDGEYKGLNLKEHATMKEDGFTTFSMFYPKDFEPEIRKKISEDGIENRVVVLRGLVMAWLNDKISVEYERASTRPFKFAAVKLTEKMYASLETYIRTHRLELTKPEIVIELVKKYVETGMKVDAERRKPGGLVSGFSVQLPVDLDEALEAKMAKQGIKFKTTLLRGLVELLLDGKVKLK